MDKAEDVDNSAQELPLTPTERRHVDEGIGCIVDMFLRGQPSEFLHSTVHLLYPGSNMSMSVPSDLMEQALREFTKDEELIHGVLDALRKFPVGALRFLIVSTAGMAPFHVWPPSKEPLTCSTIGEA